MPWQFHVCDVTPAWTSSRIHSLCHPSPAPAAQPQELQNPNRIPVAALWSHPKLTCYDLAVLLRAVWPGGSAGFGGSSPPDEMFLPTERGLRGIHRLDQQLLWSKLDVANLPTKQNKKTPHQFGSQALSINPGNFTAIICSVRQWCDHGCVQPVYSGTSTTSLIYFFYHYLETMHCTCTKEMRGFL